MERNLFLQRTGKVSNPGQNSYLTWLFLLSKAYVIATVCLPQQEDRQSGVALPLEHPCTSTSAPRSWEGKRKGRRGTAEAECCYLFLKMYNLPCHKERLRKPLFVTEQNVRTARQLAMPSSRYSSSPFRLAWHCWGLHSRDVLYLFAIFCFEISSWENWREDECFFPWVPYKWMRLL